MPDSGLVSSSHLQHISPSGAETSFSNAGVGNNAQTVNRSINSVTLNNNPESNDQNNNSNANDEDRREYFEEIRNGGGHWSHLLRQVVLTPPPVINQDNRFSKDDATNDSSEGPGSYAVIPLQVLGGSENGQFAFIGHLNNDINAWIAVGYLQPGDVILEIQKQQVAGYTQADVLSLLYHCLRINSVTLTVAPRGSLGPELRSYLNTRFQKGSVDHALQGVVRDNLYLRTVPVTTRPPRPGEIPGVDYTFLTVEEFMELERNGSLLESGVYAGNHYGTPKPWASRCRSANSQLESGDIIQSGGENSKGVILPGMHPSSEGKRRRNRSNVEALGAGDDEPPSPSMNSSSYPAPVLSYSSRAPVSDESLGPLPDNWQMCFSEKNEVYFIDHNTGTSHWLDPRLSRIQKLSLEECDDNELPFGWERIEDPHYGTYYIDHVNRRTQFENPVMQAKKSRSPVNDNDMTINSISDNFHPVPNSHQHVTSQSSIPTNHNRLSVPRGKTPVDFGSDHQNTNPNLILENNTDTSNSGLRVKSVERDRPSLRFFTRDPSQLVGERILTTLVKSSRGLGFTIVGGDDDDGLDEFLQIKSVVSDGPAWRDGKLRTGDVLVRVNGRCVLGYTHQEMVSMFQSIAPGEEVHLEVCRGYPLPFDPADPNTEIVTTVAVAPIATPDGGEKRPMVWTGRPSTPDSLAHSAHSLPELSADRPGYGRSNNARPASVDLLLDSPSHPRSDKMMSKYPVMEPAIFLTVGIIKGGAGFGFTIADSVAGQKVKKVLDPSHCGGLEEGDRLIAIDGIDLRGLSHTQVVQVLKDFPLGKEASLTIQRIQSQVIYSQKLDGVTSNHYSDTRLVQNRAGISPRSKTPTAELGRGRPRMRESLPERPKTPLLDSSGQINGQQGVYNGDLQHDGLSMTQMHQFLSERYSTSSMGLSNADPNFAANDLHQLPSSLRDWVEMTIDLQRRQEGFGFRIVGGTEEGSQVSVGHIVPRGAASLDGRLQTNDQIVAVDGVSVIGASHHSVVQLMARAAAVGRVRLVVRKPVYGAPASHETVASPAHSPSNALPIHITLRRQPTEGFGFVIISSASKAGATIGRIVEGSPADRCGQIHVSDRILAVNQIDISQLHHSQVVQLIKDSGLVLTLSVLSVNLTSGNANSNLPQSSQLSPDHPSKMLVEDLESFNAKEQQSYDMGTAFILPESHPVHFPFNSSTLTENMEQVFSVHLTRGARGFGFSIRGGKEFQNMPLFVLRLAEDGPASVDGRMQVGDQILQINGITTQGMTHSQAIHIIKTGGLNVHLLLRRGAVPFPFLSQMPNFTSGGGYGGSNGQEEEQSLSSNNDQFVGQNSPMYRDHQQLSYPPQSE
ncbi:unnamed protein product [Allacma fusca]|uniref:Uncharacterized protein n=1 Tax=Allacma fusca TaxID=39272 RepID=A0A8J2JKW5_9HEXA|nr:unnamed protein product [Allacma fusca]